VVDPVAASEQEGGGLPIAQLAALLLPAGVHFPVHCDILYNCDNPDKFEALEQDDDSAGVGLPPLDLGLTLMITLLMYKINATNYQKYMDMYIFLF
jgi:hypothetical protein